MDDTLHGLYQGTIINRSDPLHLGRVKVRVPGILDPQTANDGPWALPKGSGAANYGRNSLPPLGGDVLVQFVNGNIDYPVWEAGWPGRPIVDGVAASEAFPEHDDSDVHVFGIGDFRMVVDDREGQRSATFKFVKRINGTEEPIAWLEFNYETNSLKLFATSALEVSAGAIVNVDAPAVQVAGRKVVPSGKPVN